MSSELCMPTLAKLMCYIGLAQRSSRIDTLGPRVPEHDKSNPHESHEARLLAEFLRNNAIPAEDFLVKDGVNMTLGGEAWRLRRNPHDAGNGDSHPTGQALTRHGTLFHFAEMGVGGVMIYLKPCSVEDTRAALDDPATMQRVSLLMN